MEFYQTKKRLMDAASRKVSTDWYFQKYDLFNPIPRTDTHTCKVTH
jgi:hypothetical protein